MNVYAAIVSISWEGGYLLGVFSTEDKAQEALENWKKTDRYADYFEIFPLCIDKVDEISI